MYRNPVVRFGAPLIGYVLAVATHALWNAIASVPAPGVQLLGYLFVMVPLFVAMVGIAIFVRAREADVVSRVLPAYAAAGWLSVPELHWLSTMNARTAARSWARAVAGDAGDRAMKDYQFSATKLAVLRDRQLRGHADPDFALREMELLRAVTGQRQYFLRYSPYGPVPAVPQPSYGVSYR
jgi:hypothetical protein